MTIMKISSRILAPSAAAASSRAAWLASSPRGLAPTFAHAQAKKLVMAHLNAVRRSWPPSPSTGRPQEVRKRSNGELDMQFFGSHADQQGARDHERREVGQHRDGQSRPAPPRRCSPRWASSWCLTSCRATTRPTRCSTARSATRSISSSRKSTSSRRCASSTTASAISGRARRRSSSRRTCAAPRSACSRPRCSATPINGLGGNAVPMAWGEVISAAKQGVIDGGDLPIVNQVALKIYEVSKYCSMTFHNYGPTLNAMNLAVWERPHARRTRS